MSRQIRHIIASIILMISFLQIVKAQQISNWSSFYESGFLWNPALTAKWNHWEVTAVHKQNWTGFEDNPQYSALSFQFPFIKRVTRVTVGAFIEQDQVGPYKMQSLGGAYTYRLRPSWFGNRRRDVLRFGLSAKYNLSRFDPESLVFFDGIEANPDNINEGRTVNGLNANVGAFYISESDFYHFKSHYYFGISAINIIPNNYAETFFGNINSKPHISIHGGFRHFKFKSTRFYHEPNVFLLYSLDKTFHVMANYRYEMVDEFWLSGGLVSNGECFGQVGAIFTEDSFLRSLVNGGVLRVGFKADYSLGKIRPFRGMGYELFMSYLFELD